MQFLEAALVFLEINSIAIDASDDELVELVLKTATGSLSKTEIAVFLRRHSQSPLILRCVLKETSDPWAGLAATEATTDALGSV